MRGATGRTRVVRSPPQPDRGPGGPGEGRFERTEMGTDYKRFLRYGRNTKNCALRKGARLERSAALDILEELAIVAMVVRR